MIKYLYASTFILSSKFYFIGFYNKRGIIFINSTIVLIWIFCNNKAEFNHFRIYYFYVYTFTYLYVCMYIPKYIFNISFKRIKYFILRYTVPSSYLGTFACTMHVIWARCKRAHEYETTATEVFIKRSHHYQV